MIIKGRDKTTSIVGHHSLFKVGASFPKILIMRHYQGVGKMMF